jgi:CDP-glucose 4,6-dehydratase
MWLHALGASVHGYALNPPTNPSLFDAAHVATMLTSDTRGDLADRERLESLVRAVEPEVVFHLAAQPLVRESYRAPITTFSTNVMGTAHLLEAARGVQSVRSVVVVTTDKVYENSERELPYSENDRLGGRDPYSASKAAAELVAASYRASFFSNQEIAPRVATARAGNVIGGGDWATDRLVPDCIRAFANNTPLRLRRPDSVRPWQHVLEPVAGYLMLAQQLETADGARYASAWNFGPDASGDRTVGEIAALVARAWSGGAHVICESSSADLHEAGVLRLDSSRARTALGWGPRWTLEDALERTVSWYRAWHKDSDMRAVSLSQISAYDLTRT